jgi:two-component system LytT family response regulator
MERRSQSIFLFRAGDYKMIRAMIIDDEEKSRKLLNNLVSRYCPEIKITAMADSAKTAVQLIHKHKPEIIFLDIQMPEIDGLSLLDKINHDDIQIICTTAYDQYAIEAIRHDVLDYLLKPINIEELQQAVGKARAKLEHKYSNGRLNDELKLFLKDFGGSPSEKLLGLTTQNGITFVKLKDILYCKAEGNYTLIYLVENGAKEMVTKTLKEFETLLTSHHFFRVHRSYLINLQHINEYNRSNHTDSMDGDGGCIVMSDNVKIPVSRDRRKLLLTRFARPF